ncbi:ArsR family transcriptional regulator [Haloterrigena sp. SYSU A558-1]|uniref:ArsR family transcriptional regulator n=1 Tax=Haloterrigena gelatinilytica TaxID=2741724 RepID=A0A8J8GQU1_9EURY|nr:ArsR family transcriptional regulator [Haloterrigena gelatinilytica]NUB92312.1 ArsR family transcriptional regulator [Haloterrigena gelatinilytica]NUC71864.1 ArsR family transcriptional regulator [Haloterrigena gelatinilytica]
MDGLTPVVGYNLAIGVVVALELLYLLSLEASVTAYRRFVLVTVGGLVLAVIGGPIVELVAPQLVHWVHGLAALLVVYGLYDPVTNDVRTTEWERVLLSEPSRVRRPAEWMTPMDDEILGALHGTELVLTPAVVAFNTGFSRKEVNRRLIELADHGFVEKVERGKYRLTRRGERYLRGQLRATASADTETGVRG